MTKRRTILLAALVAVLQIAFLGSMILGRAQALRAGREVTLNVEPVDPRDLLRGEYVRLGYDISQIPISLIENASEAVDRARDVLIYLRLAKNAGGSWAVKVAALNGPPTAPLTPDEIDIRGKVNYWPIAGNSETQVLVAYGIERFYLPEGAGRQIEENMRERIFSVKLAVTSDGTAHIKQLLDGDKVIFDEPLF
ncbi:MAG: GDYXXLXY domain-containing protein [Rhizobiaceae bacterium]|nr:GDYXXLXY domain-containing protein [Rhizobiaceae bacterium]